jgi:hypothetical protein
MLPPSERMFSMAMILTDRRNYSLSVISLIPNEIKLSRPNHELGEITKHSGLAAEYKSIQMINKTLLRQCRYELALYWQQSQSAKS